MTEYLPLTEETADSRSRSEAMNRAAGLQQGAITTHWHGWITHPITGQEALIVASEDDKEFFTVDELAALLTQEQAEAADWLLDFQEEQ
jgi:hypothetical protein